MFLIVTLLCSYYAVCLAVVPLNIAVVSGLLKRRFLAPFTVGFIGYSAASVLGAAAVKTENYTLACISGMIYLIGTLAELIVAAFIKRKDSK